ncbi:MAG: four helix bundle protein [Ignavibacteriota bacterium]|nr:four helix bundle protein [Ignavibacteriota bacterium]MCO6448468.1 four helix bundle protein [Ignavibacterium album]QKJ99397.1 MAG: four helix bundle protein [Ignavibacteriota bacterium]HOJ06795.1 four helix bundle protein [Ignavibacteriaceae bacterium]
MKEHTKRRNLNRGYMKLEVWNDAINLFKSTYNLVDKISNLDYKLKTQIVDAAQSISSNIAEGYGRKSINEYLYFLNISLGSSAELLTRIFGLREINLIQENDFEEFDTKHYEVKNKLLGLVKSLQTKQQKGSWDNLVREKEIEYGKTQ